MSVYVGCPRPGCTGEVEFQPASDSDDYRRWIHAEAVSERCFDGCLLTAEEWELIRENADVQALDSHRNAEPPGLH